MSATNQTAEILVVPAGSYRHQRGIRSEVLTDFGVFLFDSEYINHIELSDCIDAPNVMPRGSVSCGWDLMYRDA